MIHIKGQVRKLIKWIGHPKKERDEEVIFSLKKVNQPIEGNPVAKEAGSTVIQRELVKESQSHPNSQEVDITITAAESAIPGLAQTFDNQIEASRLWSPHGRMHRLLTNVKPTSNAPPVSLSNVGTLVKSVTVVVTPLEGYLTLAEKPQHLYLKKQSE